MKKWVYSYYSIVVISVIMHHSIYGLIVGSDTAVSRQAAVTFPDIDSDNEMKGFARMYDGFTLEAGTTSCIYNALFPVSGEINLNEGTLNLSKNFRLSSGATLASLGTIIGNGNTVQIESKKDVTIPSSTASQLVGSIAEKDTLNIVNSVDFSFDDTYIVAGVRSSDKFIVYSQDGATITFEAEEVLNESVTSVRWHPSLHRLAIATKKGSGNNDEILVYDFDSVAKTLTKKDGVSKNTDVRAVAWNASGTNIAVTRGTVAVDIFAVSSEGDLTLLAQDFDNGTPKNNAVSWDGTESYIAVGVGQGASHDELQVYYLSGSTLSLNASENVGETVKEVAFSPVNSFIAVGLDGSSERLRIYDHDSGAGTLTDKTSAYVGETTTVLSVDWNSTGDKLLVGLASGAGNELRVYDFDGTNVLLQNPVETGLTNTLNSVRFANDDSFIVSGDTGNKVILHQFTAGAGGSEEFIFDGVVLSYGAAITLKNVARFKGVCTIEGNNNSIILDGSGAIVVDPSADLTIRNAIVEGVVGNNVRIVDATGVIVFDDVELIQTGTTTFDNGSFQVQNELCIRGPHTFSYKSDQISTVLSNSTIKLDLDVTFKYEPISGRNLLQFTDATSLLLLSGSTLSASIVGLDLLKGALVVDGASYISSDAIQLSEAIVLGDGVSSSNNMTIYNPKGTLEVTQGYVQFDNV